MSNSRFYEIDLLRFIAAFSVMSYHLSFRGWSWDNLSPVQFPELGQVTRYGYLGVNLFFIISGFVISMSAAGRSPFEFVRSRIVRLYPAYWFCLVLTTAVLVLTARAQHAITIKQFLVNLTMLQSFINVDDIAGVYWTLGVELRFYFLILAILLLGQFHRLELFLGGWLLMSAMLLAFGPIKILSGWLIPGWSGFFVAGAIFYLIQHSGMTLRRGVILIAAILMALFGRHLQKTPPALVPGVDPGIIVLLEACMFAIFFFIAMSKSKPAWLANPAFVFWGSLTYPLYLVHEDISYALLSLGWEQGMNRFLILLCVALLMLFAARSVHVWIEKPCSRPLKLALDRIHAVLFRASAVTAQK